MFIMFHIVRLDAFFNICIHLLKSDDEFFSYRIPFCAYRAAEQFSIRFGMVSLKMSFKYGGILITHLNHLCTIVDPASCIFYFISIDTNNKEFSSKFFAAAEESFVASETLFAVFSILPMDVPHIASGSDSLYTSVRTTFAASSARRHFSFC